MTLLNLNEKCSRSIVAREVVEGFDFEPKCLVLVLAHENERLAFDAMMAAGRLLSDPFVIDVNYTVATGPAPDVKLASTNCHNGKVLLRNYELDRTGQETLNELEAVRANVSTYSAASTEWKEVMRRIPLGDPDPATGAFVLYDKPPPSPPGILGPKERLVYYQEQLALNEAREAEILEEISDCFVRDRSDTVVCGLPENEARSKLASWFRVQPFSARVAHAGARPVDGAQRRQVPRLRDASDARGGLLRMCAPPPRRRTLHGTRPRAPLAHPTARPRRLGLGGQPARGGAQAAARAARRGPVLHQRGGQAGLLLAERDAHAALGHHRRRVHEPARPGILARLLQLEPRTRHALAI